MIGQTLSHYRIEKRLGEGGMGVVYAAHDEKLERRVALKLIRAEIRDPMTRERFWREARAAAALNHPGICQVHEVGDAEGNPFIVMEFLDGESLGDRLANGPLPPGEVVRIGLEVLRALGALHKKSLVHRDLKPSNVFLLADGRVKLLDFGLVFGTTLDSGPATPALTLTGAVMGSPNYMAPEQIRGEGVDGRTDLFGVAATLMEALTGSAVFRGRTSVDIMYAVLHDAPPAPQGSRELEAVAHVLRRALAKHPEERHATAEAMAADLAASLEATPVSGSGPVTKAPVARLAVLPFRLLRPQSEWDFLGPSLADAIAMSLAGIHSLVVRSPMASARFGAAAPDLREIARDLDVDSVLIGTILPVGERCRVAAQLIEVPSGNVTWSLTHDVTGKDIFQIQDAVTRRIVESLQLPLSGRERRSLERDVPASPTAYEFFLRANRMAEVGRDLPLARDLYLRSLDADPNYAPTWVRLARCYRVMGKYYPADREQNYRRAEEALARSFALHPDFAPAHSGQAAIELDRGRIQEAMDRLLAVLAQNPNDPGTYAQLMTAFRYFGLLEESLACHRKARELDPEIRTSIMHTLDAMRDLEGALAAAHENDPFEVSWIQFQLGRKEDAMRTLDADTRKLGDHPLGDWIKAIRGLARGDRDAFLRHVEIFREFPDPEGQYSCARLLAIAREWNGAHEYLERAVGMGYANVPLMEADPWFGEHKAQPRFQAALARARERHLDARARYGGRVR